MLRSPLSPFFALALFSVISAAVVLTLAVRQPWLAIDLAVPEDGPGVILSASGASSPLGGLPAGTRLLSVAPAGQPDQAKDLRAVDLIEEPDGLPDIATMRALFAHQGDLHRVLNGGAVEIRTDRGLVTVTPADSRPVTDLPDTFWIQIAVGLAAAWLGGWVLALRRREASAALLAVAGVGLTFAAHAAALYSTREIAMPAGLFYWASAINSFGAISFGAAMVSLFLVYPVRILPRWLIWACFAVFMAWAVVSFLRLTVTTFWMIHGPVTIEMALIAAGAIAQIFATRRKPQARSALRWFGLSVVLGAGSFVALIAAPQALGFTPAISQGHAFAGFLLIYLGIAIGVARYRLFEIEHWAFRIFFYAGGVVLLIVLDIALITFVALDRLPAFSLALLAVVFLYLPARDWIGRALTRRKRLEEETLFDMVSQVSLAAPGADQRARLTELLDALFHPIEIVAAPSPVDAPRIRDEGEAMDLPAFERTPALRLRWADGGRRLFSPQDIRRAGRVIGMAHQLVERRRAYQEGAEQERRRINRDIHDNIGIHLLGALHSDGPDRKDMLVRQALTDLRDIVSNSEGAPRRLADLLADLRAETHGLLEAADIALDWTGTAADDALLDPYSTATIRAVLREGVNNVLHHAGASRVKIVIAPVAGSEDRLSVRITDNGRGAGLAGQGPREGQGLANLRHRTESREGFLDFGPAPGGQGALLAAEIALGSGGPVLARREA